MRSENVTMQAQSVGELIDDALIIPEELTRAVKLLARSKPWRGDDAVRSEKFRAANKAIADALERAEPQLTIALDESACDSLGSRARAARELNPGEIRLIGRLSVVTFLWCWGLVLGHRSPAALALAVNLFKRCFPLSFAGCDMSGRVVRRAE